MEKDEPHNSHILSAENVAAVTQTVGIKKQEAHLEETGFSVGQGLGDLGGRGSGKVGGTKPFHFLPPLFPPSKLECTLS